MTYLKYVGILVGVLALLLPIAASADTELPSVRAELEALQRQVREGSPVYEALLEKVTSAQAARVAPESYQEDYDQLMAMRDDLTEIASKLSSALDEVLDYSQAHPEMLAQQQSEIAALTDLVDRTSLSVDNYLLQISVVVVTQSVLLGGQPAAERVEPEWHGSGEIGLLTGNGTLTDHDRQFFSFRQQYRNSSNELYTLMLDYDNDHSFLNLRRWQVGLKEELPAFYGGDLRMRQRFGDYRDLGSNTNSRKQLDLRLDYDLPFNQGCSEADFSYAYASKNYRAVSARSLLSHRASVSLTHEFEPRVIGDAFWKVYDYQYALGDALGSNATYIGAGVQYLPTDIWSWQLDYRSLEKSYDVRKSSAYFEQQWKLGARYQPDLQTLVEADWRYLDRNQRRSSTLGYNEDRLRLRFYRTFNPATDGDFKLEWRSKDYQVASGNDYDFWHGQLYLNYYPSYRARWYYNSDYFSYGYSDDARSYRRWFNRVGMNYNFPRGAALTTELGYTDQSYSTNTGRDYSILDLFADFFYPLSDDQDIRCYVAYNRLNQAMLASVNDYKSFNLGLEYRYRFDGNYRLILSYTYDRRDYARQTDIKDDALEARLGFEF